MARLKLSNRFSQWRKNEDLFLAYAPPDTAESKRRAKWETGKLDYHRIHIPYSLAVALSAHTYWCSVFLARNPIMQFMARSGKPEMQVMPVEALMDYNISRGGMMMPLYNWLLDPLKYGVGIVCNYYGADTVYVAEEIKVPKTWAGMPIPFTEQTLIEGKLYKSYEGNKLFNVRPYDFYPDPRVSLINFQQGEFCGRRATVSVNSILSKSYSEGYGYFNLDQVRQAISSGQYYDRGSSQLDLPDDPGDMLKGQNSKNFLSLTEMEIELIPSEWKVDERSKRSSEVLWDSPFVQKWKFTIAGDYAVIGAEPMGLLHNKFSFDLQVYELDPYAFAPRGMMEIIEPLNKTMTWLLDSHMYNVRNILNGQIIVDPSRVVMRDFEEGGAGRMIRIASSAYGTDPRTVYTQMAVQDVTQGHLRDMQVLESLIQRVTGVGDNLQGMLNDGGRKTATEVRASGATGINRLKTHAEINSSLGWQPLASKMLSNLQQFYSDELQMRIAGDLSPGGPVFTDVTSESIAGDFDFVPVDGTMPIDRMAMANLWKETMAVIAPIPQIAGQYDLGGIFAYMAKLAGLKNINQFKLQVTPDQQLQQQAQAGNLQPIPSTETPMAEMAAPPVGSVGGNGVRY
jgi:hypothetical protein